ncbi:MAG: hypothetical protein WC828_07490 [Thermoleophilia bacterium]|jgi:hypothetical protein
MWILPLTATFLGALLAGVVFSLYRSRRNPAFIVWAVALALLALASSCVFLGSMGGWTSLMAKTYYLSGSILPAGFLASGMLYVLIPRKLAHVWLAFILLVALMSMILISGAGTDTALLNVNDEPGWKALELPDMLTVVAGITRTLSILLLVVATIAGAVYGRLSWSSALVPLGIVITGASSILILAGRYEYESIGFMTGIIVIFAGIIWTDPAERLSRNT